MLFATNPTHTFNRATRLNQRIASILTRLHSTHTNPNLERLVKIINDHPFPDQPLHPTLHHEIPPPLMSSPFVEHLLGKLFASHSNGLKAHELFKHCLSNKAYVPTSDAFEKTLHILARMRYFSQAWELMESVKKTHPSILTLKSMSIMLSRISKFQSYEETLEAFRKMEDEIFVGKRFGTEEFNVLLRALCTQRQMKEARSVFNKMHARFSPDAKTMNILLLGFKETGDVTSVELFYHEMVRRGFKPNRITYGVRIDAYCKKGHFGDALRLLGEMESKNLSPTLETITTLIHGAGLARNATRARELFESIEERNLRPDCGAYNALLSAFVRSRDLTSAAKLMGEMERRKIEHDDVTYHTMFLGLIRRKEMIEVTNLYEKMVEKNFVPKARTVVMLMKCFCGNGEVDLGLGLWNYLVEKGHCPHGHALDLLVTGLCARRRVVEALACSKQMVERGRHVSELVLRMLERFVVDEDGWRRLKEIGVMVEKLKLSLPPRRERRITI